MSAETETNGPARADRRPVDRATAVVFFMAFAILASGAFLGLPFGKAVVGGLRVLDGEVPYRDFWTIYAPGQFYAVAALFGAFGREIVVQGLAAAGLLAAALAIEYRIALRLGAPPRVAAALVLALALALWRPGLELTSWVCALPLVMLAWARAIRFLCEGGERDLVVAGLCLGVAAWFKHDVAAFAAFGVAAGLLLAGWMPGTSPAGRPRAPLRAVFRVAASALAGVLPVALALALFVGPDAWEDLVAFPASDFRGVRTEGFPPWLPDWRTLIAWLGDPLSVSAAQRALSRYHGWAICRIPEAILFACLAALPFWRRLTGRACSGPTLLVIALLPPFWAAAHVQTNTHIHTLALLCGLLGASGWAAAAHLPSRTGILRTALLVAAGLYWLGLACTPLLLAGRMLVDGGTLRTLDLPGVAGVLVSPREYAIYRPIADYVEAEVPEGEPLYVGVWRHDAIVITNMRFFYMTGRRSATRHHELHPAVTDRDDVQRQIIEEIEVGGVRCAVLWKFGWPDSRLDDIVARRASAVPGVGATLLDDYLRRHFELVFEVDEYVVMRRVDDEAP